VPGAGLTFKRVPFGRGLADQGGEIECEPRIMDSDWSKNNAKRAEGRAIAKSTTYPHY